MNIRRAEKKDIGSIISLLKQVLEVHAELRPDLFVSGTTKYTSHELEEMVADDTKPIFVGVNDKDEVLGYVFCQIKEQPKTNNTIPFKYIYIDDLCVDQEARGQHVGEQLFDFVKEQAKALECYEVTLNVWTGNEAAEAFYEKMGMTTRSRHMEYIL